MFRMPSSTLSFESSAVVESRVFQWVKENLPKAKEQAAESAAEHKRRQNDAKAHTGNQVYSCGSLAPKLKKGGCSDCEVGDSSYNQQI